MFPVARGASVPCGGSMLTFLAGLANSSALHDFGEARAGHGWVLPGVSRPSTQDRKMGHGPFQEKTKNYILIFCGFPGWHFI